MPGKAGAFVKSQVNGLYAGFEDASRKVAEFIEDRYEIAKVWDIKPDCTPDYIYDDPVLSSHQLLNSTCLMTLGTTSFAGCACIPRWMVALSN